MTFASSWRPSTDGSTRYDELLLPPGVPRVSLGEGSTSLLPLADAYVKCEHINPTGSYKDRIASVGISLGVARGASGWVGTSSGNGGAAFAAYGARAGLSGRLFTVDGVVREKLAQVLAFGVDVHEVEGFGQDPDIEARVFAAVSELAREDHLVLGITASAYNAPAMAGVRSIAFEIAEQLGDAPPAVYVPSGGGGLAASLWDGFVEWQRLGFATRTPRMVVVQAAGCAPIHLAHTAGASTVTPIPSSTTTISGLQLTNPPDGDAALAAVRQSGGRTIAVDDDAVYEGARVLAEGHGLFVEPAAAAGWAAYTAEPIPGSVVILTGSGLKTLGETAPAVDHHRITLDEIGRRTRNPR